MAVVLRMAILGVLVFYVWHRLVRRTGLRGAAKIAVTAAVLLTIAPMAWVIATGSGGAPKLTGGFAWPAFIGWALFALTFAGLLITDLVWLIVWLSRTLGRRLTRVKVESPLV